MNRIGLKTASKQCIRDSSSRPYVTTFVYLVVCWIIEFLLSAVSSGSIFDSVALQNTVNIDLVDMFSSGLLGIRSSRTVLILLVNILTTLVLAVLEVGYSNYCLRLSRGSARGFGDIADALGQTGKIIWLTILINIYVFLWSLLFIIPGIVAAYRYSMAYFALMNDPSLSASEALALSRQITRGHKMQLFILDLSFLGWMLLCALTFGILYIWKMPYIYTTRAHAFNWLMSLSFPSSGSGEYSGPDIL